MQFIDSAFCTRVMRDIAYNINVIERSPECIFRSAAQEAVTMDDQPRLYSTKEAAEHLELHEGHVRRLAKRLGIGLLIGKQRVFTDADLDRLRDRNTRPGPRRRRSEAEET